MIFHRLGAGIICIAGFWLMIWAGFFKLVFWHFPRFKITGNKHSGKFVYRYMKALDCAACAGALDGKSDETISSKAGTMFTKHRFNSPWWVLFVKKLTDNWEPNHLENSIEPLRPDFFDDEIT